MRYFIEIGQDEPPMVMLIPVRVLDDDTLEGVWMSQVESFVVIWLRTSSFAVGVDVVAPKRVSMLLSKSFGVPVLGPLVLGVCTGAPLCDFFDKELVRPVDVIVSLNVCFCGAVSFAGPLPQAATKRTQIVTID